MNFHEDVRRELDSLSEASWHVEVAAPESDLRQFRVLFLGEGNFSFSHALAHFLWAPSHDRFRTGGPAGNPAVRFLNLPEAYARAPHRVQLIPTSFDTREQVISKYGDGRVILSNLDRLCASANARARIPRDSPNASRVAHEINAWDLANVFGDLKFDRIVWNHPHLGTEDFRLHRCLLAHFFSSAAGQLLVGPDAQGVSPSVVQVSLLEGQDDRWGITAQASKGGKLGLLERRPFDEGEYPGYEPKRNKTGQSFKNEKTKKHTGSVMKSSSWCFVPESEGGAKEAPEDEAVEQAVTEPAAAEASSTTASLPSNQRFKPVSAAEAHKPFQCPHCPRSYASERGRKSHIHMIHELQLEGAEWQAQPELKHECVDCGRKYGAEKYLRMHRINKHDKISKGELVALFGQEADENEDLSTSEAARRNEAEKADAGYDYVPCPVCGLAVVDADWGMQLHLENLKPVLGMEMQCPRKECGKKFIERRALWQHYRFCRLKGVAVVVEGDANGAEQAVRQAV